MSNNALASSQPIYPRGQGGGQPGKSPRSQMNTPSKDSREDSDSNRESSQQIADLLLKIIDEDGGNEKSITGTSRLDGQFSRDVTSTRESDEALLEMVDDGKEDIPDEQDYMNAGDFDDIKGFDMYNDEERNEEPVEPELRTKPKLNAVVVCCTLTFLAYCIGSWVYDFVSMSLSDGRWWRCWVFFFIPMYMLFMLFGFNFLVSGFFQMLGPVIHIRSNSLYYSAVPPPKVRRPPTVTIQMPVYKESLENVIIPSIISLEAALKEYNRSCGGRGWVFINDDGLQLVDEQERLKRIRFYQEHNIPYVARPPPSLLPRKGIFKKASNMNYALNLCAEVQQYMQRGGETDIERAVEQVAAARPHPCWAWGPVQMGDIVLLVDSDTRVPETCLSQTMGEFEGSPMLAFTQHYTSSMRCDSNFWEDMIAHFTNNIYSVGISLACSGGDPAPLVGHNAMLRWSAIQEVATIDPDDKYTLYWSESHVSEDFDMSLRLQARGYYGRYVSYTGPGFKEGVSLTCHDEVIRLRKYAFGSCEMIFNKCKDWPKKGIISPLYKSYITSPVPWHAKLNITSYLGTYFAMAAATFGFWSQLALWLLDPDGRTEGVRAVDIIFTVMIIFAGVGNFSAAIVKYRIDYTPGKGMLYYFFTEYKHMLFITIFFSGLCWHLTTACATYFLDLKIEWGATVKELDGTVQSCGEIVTTIKRYWKMFVAFIVQGALFIGICVYFPQMNSIYALLPISLYIGMHFIMPFALNPYIMRFAF